MSRQKFWRNQFVGICTKVVSGLDIVAATVARQRMNIAAAGTARAMGKTVTSESNSVGLAIGPTNAAEASIM